MDASRPDFAALRRRVETEKSHSAVTEAVVAILACLSEKTFLKEWPDTVLSCRPAGAGQRQEDGEASTASQQDGADEDAKRVATVLSQIKPGRHARFRVAHSPAVAMRNMPTVSAQCCGGLPLGVEVRGHPKLISNHLWLNLDEEWGIPRPWMLIDGRLAGLSLLLEPCSEGGPLTLALPPQNLPAKKPGRILGSVVIGQYGHFKMINKVALRQRKAVTSTMFGALPPEEKMCGTPELEENVLWLRIETGRGQGTYALMDGRAHGFGALIEPYEGPNPLTLQDKLEIINMGKAGKGTPVGNKPGDGTHWMVMGLPAGDKDTGARAENTGRGITVRRGEKLSSEAFPRKLGVGTTVEQVEVIGNRLHYKRLDGDGPDFGWVNITLKDGHHLMNVLTAKLVFAAKFARDGGPA